MTEKELLKLGFKKEPYIGELGWDTTNPDEYYLEYSLIGQSLSMLWTPDHEGVELFPFEDVKIGDIKKVKELIKAFKGV